MIPVKLSMRNFMCYRENVAPLTFDGIHTACICGDNGNGKSTLIDAMTWALWGKARAKSDDDLIHSGQTDMEVEFDFVVAERSYRIIRKRSKPKRRGRSGRTLLEFQVVTENGYKPLTGNSIRQTQQRIIETLHMDYTTFINSALLLQGRADEFTKTDPAKRKKTLADILGLSQYDELEGQAKELAKKKETEKTQLSNIIKEISDELVSKSACEAELKNVESELSHLEKVIKEQESKVTNRRREKESLEDKRLQLTHLDEHLATTERELERWSEQIKQHGTRVREYEELLSKHDEIEEGYTQLVETRKLSESLDQKLGVLVRLNERKNQLEMSIGQMQAIVIAEHRLAQGRVEDLEAKSQKRFQLEGELHQMQARWPQLIRLEEELRNKRQDSQDLKTQVHYFETNIAQLKQEIEEIENKFNLLLAQKGEARCPLCETELGADGLKLIEAKYSGDKHSKSDSLASSQAELADKKASLKLLEDEMSQLETKLDQDKAMVRGRESVLRQQIIEATEAGNRLVAERKALDEIEGRLVKKEFALTEQQALHEIEDEIAKLGYDSQQHERLRQQLASLEQYEEPKRKLEEAGRLITQERQAIAKGEEITSELCRYLEVNRQKRQGLTTKLDQLPQAVSELAQAETEYQEIANQQRQAQEVLGRAKERLQRLTALETKRQEKRKLLVETSKEEGIYKDLTQAFSKKGIQAILIELALPEIQNEANRLLSRMTDNRMHVEFESQGKTKKGDVIETLDINIADEFGTRNYEMFSGGEAFRINFAIRVALSRLLARRAGAPLPTLVIDEGFGTQDSVGIEKIKEAINSIQGDFDKILVITHMEELRDAFPTRINVIKTAEGSTLSVD